MLVEVGKLFNKDIVGYSEGVKFDISNNGCELPIFFIDPTSEEKKCIMTSKIKMGYYIEGDIIFMLVKFEGMNWMDAPYSIHLGKWLTSGLEDVEDGVGYGMTIYLINARNGIVEGLRVVGLPTNFSRKIKEIVEKQKSMPFNVITYDMQLAYIYNKLSTEQMVERANLICNV